ncbi:hypothetical protein EDD18DRAFT_383262 [Armillaria luteobubalina]|uniref:Uncharacterized protein n=1 Tax=Armillaria luteobubalina TaxID=153913 RepID=A0AA39ULD8_9AGAR|nr:hypothetical protein EDD18DRAFT_383262 [Armillaria luteobubalina]
MSNSKQVVGVTWRKVRYFKRLQQNQCSFIPLDHDGLVPFCTRGNFPSSLISCPRRASFSSNRVSDNGSPDHPSNRVLLWRIFITTSTAMSSKVIAAIMTISAGVVGGGGIVWVMIWQVKNRLILAGHVYPVTIPGRCGTIPGFSTRECRRVMDVGPSSIHLVVMRECLGGSLSVTLLFLIVYRVSSFLSLALLSCYISLTFGK